MRRFIPLPGALLFGLAAITALLVAPASAAAAPQGGAVFEKCDMCHVSTDWHTMRGGANGFDHDPTGFPLRGSHRSAACGDCHTERPLRDGDCNGCHTDPHRGENRGGCDECHGTYGWDIPQARADHRRLRLPLVGRHAGVPCADCHPNDTGNEFRAVPDDCGSCHMAEALAPSVHPPHTGFSSDCASCHTAYGWRPARVAHARFWPLTGVHSTTDCSGCHENGRYAATPTDCYSCHTADFTRGHRPGDSTRCEDCHSTAAWLPVTMPNHDRFFPLPHEGIRDCGDCHPDGYDSFTCMSCHTHSKSRMDREHRGINGYAFVATDCLRCHPRGDD